MDELKPITLAALAAITGIFGAVLILAISWLAGWPWIYAVLGLAAVSAITWLLLMRRYLAIVGPDDPVTLQPSNVYQTETPLTKIMITATDPSGAFTHGKYANLPVDIPTMIKVAKWLANGADFSMAGLCGRYRPLTRSQFESLRAAMIRDGLLFWRDPANHAQGCELTLAGRRAIKYYANRGNGHVTSYPQLPKVSSKEETLPSKARARGRAWETIKRGGDET